MHPAPRRSMALAIFVLILSMGLVAPAAAQSSPAGKLRTLALGMNMVPDRDLSVLDGFTDSIGGHQPAIWAVWGNWGDASGVFPTATVDGLRARGVTPMLVWQPQNGANVNSPNFTYRRITNGHHDAYIREFARAARDSGETVLLRFAHEMDGFWFPWGMGRFDNTPKRFIAAWRHVWNIFRGPKGVGATNVKFLWNPTYPGSGRPSFASLYPGDPYVDYVGFTSFNWNRRGTGWKSMVQLYTPAMETLRRITRKRVIIGETGSTAKGGDKPAWIRKGYPAVYNKWPRLKGIVYFNVDMGDTQQNRDWRLTTPANSLDAYESLAAQPRFQGRIP